MPKGSAVGVSLIATGLFCQPCAPAQTPEGSTDRFSSAMPELLRVPASFDFRLPNVTITDILDDRYPSAESLPVSESCKRMIQIARPGESTTPAMEANLPPSVGTSVGGGPRRVVGASSRDQQANEREEA